MTTPASKSVLAPGDIITPAGVTVDNAPPGLLDFLVGIQANESGFDYFRDQGSPAGSIGTYGGGAEEGFGAYQFTGPESDAVKAAVAANWDPATQDTIAVGMAEGYYKEFGGASNPDVWQEVSQAWWGGPGGINPSQPDPTLYDSSGETYQWSPDWPNVQAALEGDAALPPDGFVFGPGYKGGLTTAELKSELAAPTSKASLDSWESVVAGGLFGVGGLAAPAAVGYVEGKLTSTATILALKITLTAGAVMLVVVGLGLTTGIGKGGGAASSVAKAGELAAL
jgi:hypothetical protein